MPLRFLPLIWFLLFIGSALNAQDRSPLSPNQQSLEERIAEALKNKDKYIEYSAFIQITPRGMGLFRNNIYSLLQTLGSFEFEENLFPSQPPQALAPVTTEELAHGDADKLALIKTLRNFLGQWTQGLTLASPHRFVLEIGNSGYQTRFTKFSLGTDESLLQALKIEDGAILSLELEAEKINFFADRIRVSDEANPFLQKVGLEQAQFLIQGHPQAPKIKIKIPFHVALNAAGGLNFKVLKVEQNIEQMNLELKYRKLITGQFQIISRDENGQNPVVVNINTAGFAKILNDYKEPLLKEVRSSMADFLNDGLPKLLNEKFKEFSQHKLAIFDVLTPANAPDSSSQTPFIMGHKIIGLKQKNGLNLWVSSLIEDPLNPKSLPIKNHRAVAPPTLDLLPTTEVDAIMVLDQGLINRYLQLSFDRGYLSEMKSKSCTDNSESVLKLTQAPVFRPYDRKTSSDPQSAYAMLETEIETAVPPDNSFPFKKSTMRFKLATAVRIQKMKDKACEIEVVRKVCDKKSSSGKNCKLINEVSKVADPELTCLEIIKDETVPGSVSIEDSELGFWGRQFKGKVVRGITEILQQMDQTCAKAGIKSTLAESILIPPMIYGIKFDIAKFKVDKNGQLVMYLTYKQTPLVGP